MPPIPVESVPAAGTLGGYSPLLIKILIGYALVGVVCFSLLFLSLFRPTKKFSRDAAFAAGWELVKQYKWLLAGLLIGMDIVGTIPSYILSPVQRWVPSSFTIPVSIVIMICSWVLGGVVSVFLLKVLLAMVDKKFTTLRAYKEYIPSQKTVISFLLASLLFALSIVAGLFMMIVPAAIAAIAFIFYPYFVIEKGAGPIQALKMSAALTKGSRLDLFFLGILLLALNIAGTMVFFVGLFITIPLTLFVLIHTYRELL